MPRPAGVYRCQQCGFAAPKPGTWPDCKRATGELVPLVEAMTLVDEVCGAVVARVNAIPARFTRNIEQRAALQREVDEALAEVADRIEKLGATFQSGRDDPAADEEEAA